MVAIGDRDGDGNAAQEALTITRKVLVNEEPTRCRAEGADWDVSHRRIESLTIICAIQGKSLLVTPRELAVLRASLPPFLYQRFVAGMKGAYGKQHASWGVRRSYPGNR